jgi:hypothetical protein
MLIRCLKYGRPLAGLVLVLGATSSLSAEGRPGVVRISDEPRPARTARVVPVANETAIAPIPDPAAGGYAPGGPGYGAPGYGAPMMDGGNCPPGAMGGMAGGGYGPVSPYPNGYAVDPTRSYVFRGVEGRKCTRFCYRPVGLRALQVQAGATAAKIRCSFAWLGPLAYWDVGWRCDNVAIGQPAAQPNALFSAQGYGLPVTVPLAPVVADQWNYSWGVPSAHLAPVGIPVGSAPPFVTLGGVPPIVAPGIAPAGPIPAGPAVGPLTPMGPVAPVAPGAVAPVAPGTVAPVAPAPIVP